ncbi:CD44 antigen isoform X3 [Phalacrocorax aristotelis]|uniref:CD44 antigen isoform X3 n=1 Tax=Phalacrocorax aristotelis TaxID=126867 RepID=UPI003F4B4837
MANLSLWATFGFCLLKLCLTETQFNVSCRYGGVFHVEKNGRYSLTRSEAVELCRALNSTLSTLEQLKKAHELGFETCRYGFVVGNIVIPRINPYHLCAANHTGIYKLTSNTTGRYDAYCYNATETRDKVCEPIERLDTSFLNNQGEIVIDNADGSRYNADGTRHSGESSTSGADDENAGSGSTHDTTPMDTSIRRSSPSYYESATPVSQLPDHSSGGGEKEIPRKDSDYEVSPVSPDISLVTAADDSPERDGGQYPASTITSENEKRQGPTQHPLLHSVHSGWISQEQNPANTTGSTERHEFTVAGENDIAKESSHTAMASNHGAKQNDSAQDPLVYPGWDKGKDYATQPTIMDRIIPSRENNHEKESSTTAVASLDGAHHEDPTQPPLPSDNEPGQGTEGITHPTDAPGDAVLRRTTASTNKGGDDSPLTGTITESVDGVKREKATKEPLPPSTPPGSESEQASTTDGSHVNWRPGVFPDTEDRLYQLQTPLPTTVASLDGAHHEDPTQPLLPSDNEPGQGTEGITHPTDAPGDAVLRRTTASTNKGGDDSPLTGTITASTDVLQQEDITQEAWATRIVVTAVASLDGAHHEDPTQPPLPSDNEPGQGTEGITHPTDAPGDAVLRRTTAGTNKVTESVDGVKREKATKEPLPPSTPPGSESEQASTTDGSHVNWRPGVFPDTEDRLYQLQTPLPTRFTSSIYDNQGPHKGHYESTTFPGKTIMPPTSQPRSAQVPEWLIIVAALVALALILAVCIAVNSRRRCGQKKKLVINNGKGAVEDRKTSGLNGDASKSQEMVHLVHKEQSNDRTGACDEFLTINETQNHQELDMKTGV